MSNINRNKWKQYFAGHRTSKKMKMKGSNPQDRGNEEVTPKITSIYFFESFQLTCKEKKREWSPTVSLS